MPDSPPPAPTERARRRVLRDHREVVTKIDECADAVSAAWEGDGTADRESLVDPFERRLREAGVHSSLPEALATAVDAAGYDLAADPVAAPPYVVVTSTGPLLRATVADGRLVVAVRSFAVDRGGDGVRYVRRDIAAEDALDVSLR